MDGDDNGLDELDFDFKLELLNGECIRESVDVEASCVSSNSSLYDGDVSSLAESDDADSCLGVVVTHAMETMESVGLDLVNVELDVCDHSTFTCIDDDMAEFDCLLDGPCVAGDENDVSLVGDDLAELDALLDDSLDAGLVDHVYDVKSKLSSDDYSLVVGGVVAPISMQVYCPLDA